MAKGNNFELKGGVPIFLNRAVCPIIAKSGSVCIYHFLLSLLLILITSGAALASDLSGIVVDPDGQPLSDVIVRIQGTSFSTMTDKDGRFRIIHKERIFSKHITAWKQGFYNGGRRITAKRKNYLIRLTTLPKGDNTNYKWMRPLRVQQPKVPKTKAKENTCQDCHTKDFMEIWGNSAHAHSAVNPLFLSFFNGTDISGKNTAVPGYKLDFPNSNGNCATCHVPAMALNNPFNSDPNKAQGIERQGVFCDICHKVSDVNIDETGGYPGILSIKFQRPVEGKMLFFGPYDDVFPGPDTFNRLYKESRYCASCHNGRFWDALIYPEFQEWSESSYAKKNIHCQKCHMKPDGKTTSFVLKKKGGLQRDPATVYSHKFYGAGDEAFMREAMDLKTTASLEGDILTVSVAIKNIRAGHHYPTGNPMRNVILLVQTADENGVPLSMIKGEKVPEWAGVGDIKEGNYAGMPGKGFAKVLRGISPYPDQGKRDFQYAYPSPHWRPTIVDSDNRIPADSSDISSYQFRVPEGISGHVYITTRLIFRRAFKPWLDAKGLKINDLTIASNMVKFK